MSLSLPYTIHILFYKPEIPASPVHLLEVGKVNAAIIGHKVSKSTYITTRMAERLMNS